MPPSAALPAFLMVAVPVGVFAALWCGVTAFRLLRPERTPPLLRDRRAERRAARLRGEAVHVGAREIYEDMPEHTQALADCYEGRCGIPSAWFDDLYRRRN